MTAEWLQRPGAHGSAWHRLSRVLADGRYLCGCGRVLAAESRTARTPHGRICAWCEDAPAPESVRCGVVTARANGYGPLRAAAEV